MAKDSKTKIVVDLWKTGAHSIEVGIKQQEVHRAKSRQYTADTDIIGEYQGRNKGYLTVREDPWKTDENEQRLIMKLFTESMNWKGTIEEMVAWGTSRSLAAGEGLAVFTINLTNYDRLITLERIFKPKSMNKAMFSFMLIDEDQFYPYTIEADRLTLGSDWTIHDKFDNQIGKIDGAGFNIGGKFDIELDDTKDHHAALDEVLILFCGMLKYEKDIRKRLESVSKKLKKTKEGFDIKISSEELFLYENPRRLKY